MTSSIFTFLCVILHLNSFFIKNVDSLIWGVSLWRGRNTSPWRSFEPSATSFFCMMKWLQRTLIHLPFPQWVPPYPLPLHLRLQLDWPINLDWDLVNFLISRFSQPSGHSCTNLLGTLRSSTGTRCHWISILDKWKHLNLYKNVRLNDTHSVPNNVPGCFWE